MPRTRPRRFSDRLVGYRRYHPCRKTFPQGNSPLKKRFVPKQCLPKPITFEGVAHLKGTYHPDSDLYTDLRVFELFGVCIEEQNRRRRI